LVAIALAVLLIGGVATAMNGGGDGKSIPEAADTETTTTTGANSGETGTTVAPPTGVPGSTTLPGTKTSGPGVVATTNTTSNRTVTLPTGGTTPPLTTPPPTTPPPTTPLNRTAVTSYYRDNTGLPYNGRWEWARQSFVASSNVITKLGAVAGIGPLALSGEYFMQFTLTTKPDCFSGRLGTWTARVINYGITVADIGDINVTRGATYYYCWFPPSPDFITYWGATSGKGTSAAKSPVTQYFLASDEFGGIVQGYSK